MKINKTEISEKAKQIINDLVENYSFLDFISEISYKNFSNWEDLNQNYSNKYEIKNGASRFVIYEKENPNFVLKFLREYGDSKFYDSETKTKSPINYNEIETVIYEYAEKENISEFFAWSYKLFDFDFNGKILPIYVMEFIDSDEDIISEDSGDYQFKLFCEEEGLDPEDEESREKFNDNNHCCVNGTDAMLEFAENYWGEEEFNSVSSLLERANVHDLHCGNWGYRDNQLVIIDYAGYDNVCPLVAERV